MRRQFLVASPDSSPALDALEKVLDPVALFIPLAIPSHFVNPVFPWRDARFAPLVHYCLPKFVAVIAFVGDDLLAGGNQDRFRCLYISTVTSGQLDLERPSQGSLFKAAS